jgi:hypothetical protein
MAAIMTAFAAAAFVLLFQAIHTVKTGSAQWFFISALSGGTSPSRLTSNRVQGVLWYGLPGCALLALLVYAAVEHGKSAMLALRVEDWGNLVGGLILFTGGLSIAVPAENSIRLD